MVFGRTLVQTCEICERRNFFPIFFVATDGAVGKAQRERCVRIIARAFNGKTRLGDFGIGLLLDLFLNVVRFPRFTGRPIDQTGKFEHGIVNVLQCRLIFTVNILAEANVFQLCAGHKLDRTRVRRFARKDLLYQGIVSAKLLGEIGHRIRQSKNYVVVVNRLGRKELELERLLRTVTKWGNTFAVWLATFLNRASQQPGVFKERSIEGAWTTVTDRERTFLLQVAVTRRDSGQLGLSFLNSIIGIDRRF